LAGSRKEEELMTGEGLTRLGAVCGLLYVLLMVPAYVVGYPDAPTSASGAEEVVGYFGDSAGAFVTANGVIAVFSTFFFLWFLGALRALIRAAEGEGVGLSSAVLVGGIIFIALSCAGYAAELVYPATVLRFENFSPGPQAAFTSLALSAWLYHFCQVGASVMIAATSLVALGTGVLPRWLALAGFVAALLTLLHFLLPLLGSVAGLLWIASVSALMLAASGGVAALGRRAR
jgi:hypothetical protein